MRVLFIEPPPTVDWRPGSRASTAGRRHPSLNFTGEQVYSYLNLQSAAVLRQRGHEVLYLHCQTMGYGLDRVGAYLREKKPGLVVLMLEHITFPVALEVLRMAKEEVGAVTALVGPFATAESAKVLTLSGADVVCRGEWDLTVAHLAEALEAGRPLDEVTGLLFRRGDALHETPAAGLAEDLDALPLPAYDLLDLSKFYESVFQRFPAATMITSRGCPHRCVFCSFPQTIYSRKYRFQSPERVLAEVKYLHRELGVKEIRFDDDCFEVKRDRVFRISELLGKECPNVLWSAQCRPANLDPELARAMKRGGCGFVLFGVESGDDDILRKIRKGTTVDEIRRGVAAARGAGLDILNCVMLGFYWDTPETVEKTIRFAFELNAEFTQFSTPTPLPGTEYYGLLRSEGCLLSERWEDFDSFHHANVRLPHLTAEELNETIRTVYRRYYGRPSYVWRMLKRALRSRGTLGQTLRGARALLLG
ncbi:MAG: radical SAM protein [Deltaproteobacteria bacterium]|nr:radical SAM protein [Deltaproteobacteria bacterium]